jgi:hypothetical protein
VINLEFLSFAWLTFNMQSRQREVANLEHVIAEQIAARKIFDPSSVSKHESAPYPSEISSRSHSAPTFKSKAVNAPSKSQPAASSTSSAAAVSGQSSKSAPYSPRIPTNRMVAAHHKKVPSYMRPTSASGYSKGTSSIETTKLAFSPFNYVNFNKQAFHHETRNEFAERMRKEVVGRPSSAQMARVASNTPRGRSSSVEMHHKTAAAASTTVGGGGGGGGGAPVEVEPSEHSSSRRIRILEPTAASTAIGHKVGPFRPTQQQYSLTSRNLRNMQEEIAEDLDSDEEDERRMAAFLSANIQPALRGMNTTSPPSQRRQRPQSAVAYSSSHPIASPTIPRLSMATAALHRHDEDDDDRSPLASPTVHISAQTQREDAAVHSPTATRKNAASLPPARPASARPNRSDRSGSITITALEMDIGSTPSMPESGPFSRERIEGVHLRLREQLNWFDSHEVQKCRSDREQALARFEILDNAMREVRLQSYGSLGVTHGRMFDSLWELCGNFLKAAGGDDGDNEVI